MSGPSLEVGTTGLGLGAGLNVGAPHVAGGVGLGLSGPDLNVHSPSVNIQAPSANIVCLSSIKRNLTCFAALVSFIYELKYSL